MHIVSKGRRGFSILSPSKLLHEVEVLNKINLFFLRSIGKFSYSIDSKKSDGMVNNKVECQVTCDNP